MELNQNQNQEIQKQQERIIPNPEQETPAAASAEDSPKLYSEEELNSRVDELLKPKLARKTDKIRKELEGQYGELVALLKAGTGKDNVADITEMFKKHYSEKGVKVSQQSKQSARDIEILAKADAADIINAGYDEVVEEVERLAKLGVDKMTARDKVLFRALAEHRQSAERAKELAQIGVGEDVYNSEDFKSFAAKFDSKTPITEVYDFYNRTKPKQEIQTMGSMKSTSSDDNGVKDFYTPEEAKKFTKKDLDNNPALFAALERSMQRWK